MKISNEQYAAINERLKGYQTNINVIKDQIEDEDLNDLTDREDGIFNLGILNGYLLLLDDLNLPVRLGYDGNYRIDPKCVNKYLSNKPPTNIEKMVDKYKDKL